MTSPAAQDAIKRWTPLCLFLLALVLRGWNYASVTLPIDDSEMHVPEAFNYAIHGYLGPDGWWAPPLRHLLLEPFIALLGNDPVGWRFRAVLFGAGCVVVTFLLARRAIGSYFAALAAALLVAFDPLSIAFSHATQEDVVCVFFMLVGLLFFALFDRDEHPLELLGAGAAFGVAMSFRQFALLPLLAAAAVCIILPGRTRRFWLPAVAYLVATPAAIYIAAYLPWMTRGYTPLDLPRLLRDSYVFQSEPGFYAILGRWAGPYRWLLGFIRHGEWVPAARGKVTISLLMTNPPVWWLMAPATVWVAFTSWRRKSRPLLAIAASFALLFAAFASSPRPILIYSAVYVLPLGAICTGSVLGSLPRRVGVAALALMCAWCLYLFPLVSGIPVRFATYSWLLESLR